MTEATQHSQRMLTLTALEAPDQLVYIQMTLETWFEFPFFLIHLDTCNCQFCVEKVNMLDPQDRMNKFLKVRK